MNFVIKIIHGASSLAYYHGDVNYLIATSISNSIQWNLFIVDTLGPAISGSFLLFYRGFPLSEVKMD